MLLIMAVSLYTSRIVLNTLGVEDFGIYNVVGGFVTMFGFLNSAMASATQRFLAFEIGRNDKIHLRNVFSMSVNIHFFIAFIILILAETVGLWFINAQLTIPPERMIAAQWVYQFSILTLMVNIVSVPYNAMIIAHERMGIFAGMSIIEVILKLFIVFMLQWFGFDKLKLYAILMFGVALIIRVIYKLYCNKQFMESKFRWYWDQILFKQIFRHSGWMLFGTSTSMLSGQGVNMIMNIFFGVTVNAARGIAYQLQGAVNGFISNYMMAVQPQIIKTYAQNEYKEMYKLVFSSSKFSFFLLFLISLPVLLLTETILQWWLKIIPDHATLFARLTIIDLFFTALFPSIATVSQASGKIRSYQLVISISFFMVFIITYLLYKLGYPCYFAFIVMILTSFLGLFARILILKIQLFFPARDYILKVLLPICYSIFLSIPIPLVTMLLLKNNNDIFRFLSVCIISVFSTIMGIWIGGINKNEKEIITNKVLQLFNKLIRNK